MTKTFKDIWGKLMAKETTTTFTVTVQHPGAEMQFFELFGTRGRCKSTAKVVPGMIKTETKTIPSKERYTPEQKMGRMLLKEACELAGLKYSAKYSIEPNDACYNVKHSMHTYQHTGRTIYQVCLTHACMEFNFRSGVGSPGTCHIRRNSRSWNSTDPIVDVSFADPQVVEKLSKIFAQWGKGPNPNNDDIQNEQFTLDEFVKEHVSI